MSLTFALSSNESYSFIMDNSEGEIRKLPSSKVSYASTLSMGFYGKGVLDYISATSPYATDIEDLLKERDVYISKRNNILDNPFKYSLPSYRRKLKKIDEYLDNIEMKIFSLERRNSISEADLTKIVHSAEKKLEKYADFL